MKNFDNELNKLNQERECSLKGVCRNDSANFSLKELTVFGLEILSKGGKSR